MAQKEPAIYRNCMGEIQQRIKVAKDVLADIRSNEGDDVYMAEIVFLQLRKILELLAFASLTANREVYAKARNDFERDWNAKRMLKTLRRVNPEFWPTALEPPTRRPDGTKHFERVLGGYMTQGQFVVLYDKSSSVIHVRNPFKLKDPVTNLGFHVSEWIRRIETLLRWHVMELVNEDRWVVHVPETGNVHVWPATPNTAR